MLQNPVTPELLVEYINCTSKGQGGFPISGLRKLDLTKVFLSLTKNVLVAKPSCSITAL